MLDRAAPLRVGGFDRIIEGKVAFIDSASVDILLGQRGFFEHFTVLFHKAGDYFELEVF